MPHKGQGGSKGRQPEALRSLKEAAKAGSKKPDDQGLRGDRADRPEIRPAEGGAGRCGGDPQGGRRRAGGRHGIGCQEGAEALSQDPGGCGFFAENCVAEQPGAT